MFYDILQNMTAYIIAAIVIIAILTLPPVAVSQLERLAKRLSRRKRRDDEALIKELLDSVRVEPESPEENITVTNLRSLFSTAARLGADHRAVREAVKALIYRCEICNESRHLAYAEIGRSMESEVAILIYGCFSQDLLVGLCDEIAAAAGSARTKTERRLWDIVQKLAAVSSDYYPSPERGVVAITDGGDGGDKGCGSSMLIVGTVVAALTNLISMMPLIGAFTIAIGIACLLRDAPDAWRITIVGIAMLAVKPVVKFLFVSWLEKPSKH